MDGLVSLYEIDLSNNKLTDMTGLYNNVELRILKMAGNKIPSVSSLETLRNLESVDLSNNAITQLDNLRCLSFNIHLKSLWLSGNPVTKLKGYKITCRNLLPGLYTLDGKKLLNSVRDDGLFQKTTTVLPNERIDGRKNYGTNLILRSYNDPPPSPSPPRTSSASPNGYSSSSRGSSPSIHSPLQSSTLATPPTRPPLEHTLSYTPYTPPLSSNHPVYPLTPPPLPPNFQLGTGHQTTESGWHTSLNKPERYSSPPQNVILVHQTPHHRHSVVSGIDSTSRLNNAVNSTSGNGTDTIGTNSISNTAPPSFYGDPTHRTVSTSPTPRSSSSYAPKPTTFREPSFTSHSSILTQTPPHQHPPNQYSSSGGGSGGGSGGDSDPCDGDSEASHESTDPKEKAIFRSYRARTTTPSSRSNSRSSIKTDPHKSSPPHQHSSSLHSPNLQSSSPQHTRQQPPANVKSNHQPNRSPSSSSLSAPGNTTESGSNLRLKTSTDHSPNHSHSNYAHDPRDRKDTKRNSTATTTNNTTKSPSSKPRTPAPSGHSGEPHHRSPSPPRLSIPLQRPLTSAEHRASVEHRESQTKNNSRSNSARALLADVVQQKKQLMHQMEVFKKQFPKYDGDEAKSQEDVLEELTNEDV